MSLQVFGIPTCTTCKKALQWLKSNRIPHDFIDTKTDPPSLETVTAWVDSLGALPLRNTSGHSYRELGDQKQTWTEADWIRAFSQDAMLLKRPLFVKDGKAVMVGFRDPERIRQVLGV